MSTNDSADTLNDGEVDDCEGWDDTDDFKEDYIEMQTDRMHGYVHRAVDGEGAKGGGTESDSEDQVQLTEKQVPCTCKINCLNQFDSTKIDRHVTSLRVMDKDQREIFIMGTL